ncbi:hypothetical protein K7X08_001816 [Anisodus acutangulus]|uniref:F-box associated domain-containing protein n=1 Tax=Anisodus acutangulus TaxID=402998 RepID=A0A9Q1LQC5_9SOLA|nr:hypothetical protein K7X08_001816 [Anisodus acutangulus]
MTKLIGSMDGLFYLECEIDLHYGILPPRRDSWRIFRPKNFYKFFLSERKDVSGLTYGTLYLNGAYYWLLTGKCSILSFDFGSEVFEEIGESDDHSVNSLVFGLILLDDSIAILNTVERFVFDIWVMIQPGVWNKLVTFQCFTNIKSCYDSSLSLVTRASRLVSYNVRMKKTRHLGFRHLGLRRVPECGGCGVHCYKESLVTIKRREVADIFD